MADFCKKCSIEHFGEDTKDLVESEPARPGYGYVALCEGCWHTCGCLVTHEGLCLVREAMEHAGIYKEGEMRDCSTEVINAYLHTDVPPNSPAADVAVSE